MDDSTICPYFGTNEDLCDVGCGYISSSDVRTIISYCREHFASCMKFRELSDRHPVPQEEHRYGHVR